MIIKNICANPNDIPPKAKNKCPFKIKNKSPNQLQIKAIKNNGLIASTDVT